ncbi:ubiquitin-like protease (Ul), putative [Theileria annulata]|uniref:Ubiquitin-like protease (Ul), putative n=1 Tax=Theileria annulata TaxID=5874 RepID=Q4U8H6_THEAN|nr:ubiquitin-like protease (Ul), putative [Theileria annulata]CAI76877.1 ubiquitin-like protease (Ul), putative [Theileria annulata]|eukprot:XP_953502.1 ubiquitin-like protease (Ul), putative [Theileria annulata]
MIKRSSESSILDVMLMNDVVSATELFDSDPLESPICKYFVYGFYSYTINSENNAPITRNNHLLLINTQHQINFYPINQYNKDLNSHNSQRNPTKRLETRDGYMDSDDGKSYYDCVVESDEQHSESDVVIQNDDVIEADYDVIELKKNTLNLRKIYMPGKPSKTIAKNELQLIIESPVKVGTCEFNFCALLETGNKLTLFYYDSAELEYLNDSDTITLDHITIKDVFPTVKSVYNECTISTFSEIYHLLSSSLKRFKFRLKGFDEVENLFDVTLTNYKIINSILETVNYDGLCINKCYLDEKNVESFSSFSYLDDSIIDFFNQFTYKYLMDESQRKTWVILSTYFVRKIKQYKDPKEAYTNTWKWTRKFTRALPMNDFIFIPINLSEVHWSLVIIAYPKYAIRYHSIKSEKKASIIHLDSLGNHHLSHDIIDLLKNYLYQEYDNRCRIFKERGFEFDLDPDSWDYIAPSRGVPLQNNGYDCGIYLIEYIMYLTRNKNEFSTLIPKYFEPKNVNRTESGRYGKWFTQVQIHNRRLSMKQVLKFMRDNPNWSTDQNKIQYVIDQMTQQY